MNDNGCTLSWNPPKSDGGSEILGYLIEKRDMKKNTWTFVARTTATSADVRGLIEGNQYLLRVAAENSVGSGPAVESAEPISIKNPYR